MTTARTTYRPEDTLTSLVRFALLIVAVQSGVFSGGMEFNGKEKDASPSDAEAAAPTEEDPPAA